MPVEIEGTKLGWLLTGAWVLVTLGVGLAPSFRDIDYKEFFSLLGFFLILTLWAITNFKKPVFRFSKLDFILVLFAVWMGLSLLWCQEPSAGMEFLKRVLPCFGLYFLVRQNPGMESGAKVAWMTVVLLACFYGMAQKFLLQYIPHLPGGEPDRIYSFFGNPNVYAAFLVLSWPVLLLKPINWLSTSQNWFRLGVVILMLLNLGWANSRAGSMALGIQLLLMMVLMGTKPYRKPVRLGMLVFIVASLLLSIFFSVRIWDRPTERVTVWKCAALMAMEKPVTGWGVNQFSIGFPGFMSEELKSHLQKDNTFAEHVHNEPLELWVELGIVGLALAISFWGMILSKVLGLLWKGRKGKAPLDLATLGLFLGLAGVGITNLFDYNSRLPGVGFFLWIATAWLAYHYESTQPLFLSPGLAKALNGFILLAGISGLLFFAPQVYSRVTAPPDKNFLADLPADLAGEKHKLESAIAQNPKDPNLYHQLGNVEAKLRLMDEAQKDFETEIKLNPAAAGAYLNLGNICLMKGDQNTAYLKQAIAYYSQSVILDPQSVDGHFDLAFALFVKKDLKGALDQLDEVLKLDPENEKALSLKRQIIL